MPNSIKFDSTELLNTTYIPRYVKHESSTDRELGIMNLARDNGSVLVNDRRGTKTITLKGILTGATESALETAIDNFKELFSRQQKNLDISWAGSTRRYVATCKSHNFDRDYFHLLFVPWTAEFIVLNGVGEDLSETIIVDSESFGQNYKTKTISLGGTASPKIKFSIDVNSPNNYIYGVQLKNTATGEAIMAYSDISSLHNKILEIDTRLKTVKIDGFSSKYIGMFPNFIVGNNKIMITLGDIVDQEFSDIVIGNSFPIYQSLRAGQSFTVPYTNSTYRSIWLHMSYIGDPVVICDVRIETDNNGEPSGTLVSANSKGDIDKSEMAGGSINDWYKVNFDGNFTLHSNTPYWIVVKMSGPAGDVNNRYNWGYEDSIRATYKNGNASFYDSGWTDWPTTDALFKICYGGINDLNFPQEYSISQIKRFL